MFKVIKNRRWHFLASGILVALSITALVISTILSGLPLALNTNSLDSQTIQAAGLAAPVALIAILLLTWWLFRAAPNALRYSGSAFVTTAQNLLIPFGFYALMGMLAGWQADTLFFVAILALIGLSVQDVIPLISCVRENASTHKGEPRNAAISRAILDRFNPTLATRLCAVFILVALLFIGGPVILPLAATLLVGVLYETYSSIFVAALLLTL